MPLSKARDKERKRLERLQTKAVVQPKLQPVQPNRYLLAHIKAYPDGFNPDGSYRKDYDPKLDPYINPLLRPDVQPNSNNVKPRDVTKPSVTPFEELRQKYDIRLGYKPEDKVELYNPNKHYSPGDKVLVKPMYGRSKKLVEVTIPELDADGNSLPDYDGH